MKTRKLAILLVLFLAISSFLMACSNDSKSTSGNKGTEKSIAKTELDPEKQILNLAEASEIPSMDPSIATDQVSFIVMANVFEGLYTLGEGDKVENGIAKGKPKKSEDGKVWTIELRENAKWSNGDPVTAGDFVFSWRRAVDPNTAAEYAFMMYPIKNAEKINSGEIKDITQLGVKAIDDHTLEITFEKVYPYTESLLSFSTFAPQNEKFFTEQGENYGKEFNTVIYNGPFMLTSWTHEQGWTYEPNPNYWDKDNVHLKKINVKVVKDNNTRVQLYESGELDRARLMEIQVAKYKNNPDYYLDKGNSSYFIKFNQKNELLKNVDARKAIAMAFDKNAFAEKLIADGSTVADFLVPADFVFGPDGKDFRDGNGNMNSYNVKKAQEHWEKAKQALGKDTFNLEFLNYDVSSAAKVGVFIKEELEKNLPGLTVTIKPQPFKQMIKLQDNLDYDFAYAGWGPDYPDPMTFMDLYLTSSGFNRSMYSNPEYDKLIEDANSTLLDDPQERWNAMIKAEKILIEEDQAIAPLYQNAISYLQKSTVHNIYFHKFGGDYTYKSTYIK